MTHDNCEKGHFLELNKVYCMDCFVGLSSLPDDSVNLIIADPPYFNIMKTDHAGNKFQWDKQWKDIHDYTNWCEKWLSECRRVLRSNGSLYVFADDKVVSYLQVTADKIFFLENHIVWVKPNNMTIKGWRNYGCFAPITERLLFYSKEKEKSFLQNIHDNKESFKEIKDYMRYERKKCMQANNLKTSHQFSLFIRNVTKTASVVDRHYFSDSQYVFPTKEHYTSMQKTGFWQKPYEELRRTYEELRRTYEELRRTYEELRRTFNITKNHTDVWSFPITPKKEKKQGYHPTQKPVELLKRIILASSKEGDLIVDPFAGSGTSLLAAQQTNRMFIGFEKEEIYTLLARKRLEQKSLAQHIISDSSKIWEARS